MVLITGETELKFDQISRICTSRVCLILQYHEFIVSKCASVYSWFNFVLVEFSTSLRTFQNIYKSYIRRDTFNYSTYDFL